MADIVDIFYVVFSSMVKIFDFRGWERMLFHDAFHISLLEIQKTVGAFLAGQKASPYLCIYAVEDDCHTTVWTYKQIDDDLRDSFQPDEKLKKKIISYIRRHRDQFKFLGTGSNADNVSVLSFGSLFTDPYKGSDLHVYFCEVPEVKLVQLLLQKV